MQFRLQFEDQLHFFVEECDHLQGFQLLADVHNGGFAAVASGLAQLLHDDVGVKTLLTVGTAPTQLEEEVVSNHRIINILIYIMYMPNQYLHFPVVKYYIRHS